MRRLEKLKAHLAEATMLAAQMRTRAVSRTCLREQAQLLEAESMVTAYAVLYAEECIKEEERRDRLERDEASDYFDFDKEED